MRRPWEIWDEKRAKEYPKWYGTPTHPKPAQKRRMLLAMSLIEGESVFDIGCGVGHLYPYVTERGIKYIGADNSDAMLSRARGFFPEATFIHADIFDLSNLGFFDTIISQDTLIHLPEIEKPINEMWNHATTTLIFSIPLASEKIVNKWKTFKEGKYLLSHAETRKGVIAIIEGLPHVKTIFSVVEPESSLNNTYFKATRDNDFGEYK